MPAALRLAGGLGLADGLPEPDVLAHLEAAGRRQPGPPDRLVCFAGAGAYDHEVPPVVRALAGRSEFVTSYTPYQPEVAQGVLQAVFEFQTMVARLSGLPVANASLYDGASALVEAVNLGVAATGRHDGLGVGRASTRTGGPCSAPSPPGTGHRLVDVPLRRRSHRRGPAIRRRRRAARRGRGRLPQLPRLPRGPGRGPAGVRPPRRAAGGGGRPGGGRHPALARRVGRRRGGGGGPGLRHAAELRRPLPRAVRLHAGPRPPPARPLVGETVDAEGRRAYVTTCGPASRTSAGRRPPPTSAPTRP